MDGIAPKAQLISERDCDFAETLAALHELLDSTVQVWILGAKESSRAATVTLCGRVEPATELGPGDSAPTGIEVTDATLVVSPDSFAIRWRDEYERLVDGRRWLVVALRYRGGTEIEIEQVLEEPS